MPPWPPHHGQYGQGPRRNKNFNKIFLVLNLSTRVRKSNFDYSATKMVWKIVQNMDICLSHGQVSMLRTIVQTVHNCPYSGQLSIQWTIVHTMDNCPCHGLLAMVWTIIYNMDNCHTIVHIMGNVHNKDNCP